MIAICTNSYVQNCTHLKQAAHCTLLLNLFAGSILARVHFSGHVRSWFLWLLNVMRRRRRRHCRRCRCSRGSGMCLRRTSYTVPFFFFGGKIRVTTRRTGRHQLQERCMLFAWAHFLSGCARKGMGWASSTAAPALMDVVSIISAHKLCACTCARQERSH